MTVRKSEAKIFERNQQLAADDRERERKRETGLRSAGGC